MDTKGDKTRNKLITAAIKLIASRGFEGTSFQAIADTCKVSQSALFHHFKSKGDLLRAAINKIVLHNHQIVSECSDVADNAYIRTHKHFAANLDWAMQFPEEAKIILLLYYQSSFDSEFSKLYDLVLEKARERILGYVLSGQRERLFNLKMPAIDVAQMLHDLLVGGIVNLLASGSKPRDKLRTMKLWKKMIAILVGSNSK